MQKSDIKTEVRRLESKSKSDLRARLTGLLYPDGKREVPTNLKNSFLLDCYKRIEPAEHPVDRAQRANGYDESWGDEQKKTLATALNMLLTERVGRDSSPIKSQTKRFLAQVIVAIRLTDAGETVEFTHTLPDPPERESISETQFTDGLALEDASETELVEWVESRRSTAEGQHAVYVLDCTPIVGDNEPHLSKRFRARVHKKVQEGIPLSEKEMLGKAVNDGQRIYYVGYATDVVSRMQRHLNGVDRGGAHVTHTFLPKSLVEVTWYKTETQARKAERHRAQELTIPGETLGYYN